MQLTTGTLLQGGKYRIESMLGQGAYGITYLATTKVKGPLGDIAVKVAVKEFFSKELNTRKVNGNVSEVSSDSLAGKYSNMFLREARNLSLLKHDGVVNVLEAFSENNTHYYVMEYVDGGSLDAYVRSKGRLSERETLSLARQIGSALAFMHDNKMLHLDLKPKNIMLRADGTLCLIDFGLSKQYEANGEPESSTTIGLGTPGYAPLEQGDSDDRKTFAPTLDIYAFGATLFKMLTGKTPPRASDIFNEGFPAEDLLSLAISEETISAIRHAMSPRKDDRPQTVEEFLLLLKDPGPVPKEVDKDDTEDTELEGEETEDTEKKEGFESYKKQVIHWIDIKEFLNENRVVFSWHPTKKYRHFVCCYVIFAALLSCLFIVLAVLFDTDWCFGFFVWYPALYLGIFCMPSEWKTKSLIYDVEYLDEYFVRKGNKGISYSFRTRSIGGKLGLCVLIRNNPRTFKMEPTLEIEYDDIIKINEKTFICRKGKTYGLFRYTFPRISSKHNWVLSMEYDMIEVLSDNKLRVVKGDKSYKYTFMGYRVVE